MEAIETIDTEKLIDKYKSNNEIVNEELNEIWSTLTSNIENYSKIDKDIQIVKKSFEEKIVKETPPDKLLLEDVKCCEKVIEIDKEELVPSMEQVEYYMKRIRLFYEKKNSKSAEMLMNLDRIKRELDGLHALLSSK